MKTLFKLLGTGTLALLVSACGGSETADTTTTSILTTLVPETTTTTSTTTTTVAGPVAVESLQDVRGAVVRIVAQGSFVDPDFGPQVNAAGSGSGFIIDPSGIAVTNNHVVTGAAKLDVYVEGEDEPRNARVLGVSECSDLAVIDIEGEGFPFVEWYQEPATAGLPIYVAGYPLGTEEYTLLDGIVSKENADGETWWASVDHIIETSADALPGNSGGPLVTEDGKVVAILYSGDEAGQAFAIGGDIAQEVVEVLRSGQDEDSVGINGSAYSDFEVTGVWVASVETGSPAALAGIRGGDVVTSLEGLLLATDGTMSDYCDIIRSHASGEPMAVEVVRYSTEEVLEGVLNGQPLQLSFSFAQTLDDDVGTVGPATYSEYTTVTDDTGAISVSLPVEWTDVSGVAWDFGGELVGAAISASSDRDAWYAGWDTPGVFFGASASLVGQIDIVGLLGGEDFSADCAYDGRYDYEDPLYVGQYDLYTDCGGLDTLFIVLAAEPLDRSSILLVEIIAVSEADLEAIDQILNSFVVVGAL